MPNSIDTITYWLSKPLMVGAGRRPVEIIDNEEEGNTLKFDEHQKGRWERPFCGQWVYRASLRSAHPTRATSGRR